MSPPTGAVRRAAPEPDQARCSVPWSGATRTDATVSRLFGGEVVTESGVRTATVVDSSMLRYLGVGVLSYGVDLGLLALCYSVLGLPLWLSTSVGFWTSFVVNFGLNRSVTFRSRGPATRQLVRYSILVALNYVASLLIVGLAEGIGVGYAVGKTVSVAILVVVNYVAYRWWVFR